MFKSRLFIGKVTGYRNRKYLQRMTLRKNKKENRRKKKLKRIINTNSPGKMEKNWRQTTAKKTWKQKDVQKMRNEKRAYTSIKELAIEAEKVSIEISILKKSICSFNDNFKLRINLFPFLTYTYSRQL